MKVGGTPESILPYDLSEGAIIADQWEKTQTPGRLNSDAKRLMFAMLEEALGSVLNATPKSGRSRITNYGYVQFQRRRTKQAELDRAWFADRTRWDFGSFNNIWSTLFPDFDLEKARREILEKPAEVLRRLRIYRQGGNQ